MISTHDQTAELEAALERIWDLAAGFGLDPFPVHFELVPATIMYEFGAYGLPGRFSHWTHGRTYQQIKTMYDYGLSKIYELVINSNPAEAFLLETNSVLQNKLVIAHVLGHSDFFKYNEYFKTTNRHMVEAVSVNADRIRQYEFHHGRDEVERFLDAVLSIQEHVDVTRRPPGTFAPGKPAEPPSGPYDDLIYLGNAKRPPAPVPVKRVPSEPAKDLMLFLAEHARDLEDWQRDVLHIVRTEQLYFVPQMQTKIMNEGWAAYWHAQIMRELDLSDDEYVEFAGLHAGVLASSGRSMNPYQLGMRIFEDIERRWDQPAAEGRDGPPKDTAGGRAKMFEVRQLDSDVSFLRNYLTEDIIEELDLYLYRREGDRWVIVEKDWEKVRDAIVSSMTNFGQPYIVVEDGDYRGNRELYLRHQFEGHELDRAYAEKTLQQIYRLWGRAVHLETVYDEQPTLWSFDGSAVSSSSVSR